MVPLEDDFVSISPFHDPSQWIFKNDYAFAILDAYPVSKGHTLVVPKGSASSISDLTEREILACMELIDEVKEFLIKKYKAEGFNIGVNEGKVAGQTIHQLHFHVIPRYTGDVSDPVGGIRNIFPGRGNYTKESKSFNN